MRDRKSGEWKHSLFDKYGPDAADLVKTATWLPVWGVAGGGIGCALAIKAGLSVPVVVISAIAGAVLTGLIAARLVIGTSRGIGSAFGAFIQPSGDHTPYERQYSAEDSLVMRGDVEGALSSYEGIIAESPSDATPRLRAAEICARGKMYERAEGFFRGVQRLPNLAVRDDVYASNRLVDVYLSWPGHEKKALRELRRLIDTYRGSEIAERAHQGLATLKNQLGTTE